MQAVGAARILYSIATSAERCKGQRKDGANDCSANTKYRNVQFWANKFSFCLHREALLFPTEDKIA